MVKLVVHIGHGKTGSTSIQQSLLAARPALATQGVHYLGLMLEHAQNAPRPAWQIMSGSNQFFDGTDPATANAELLAVLESELARLERAGVARAIWSNEWLLERSRSVLPALCDLKRRGQAIEIQCYVRRHDKWAQSAYAQWGLKHKSYAGPIRDFASWLPVFGDREFRFAPALAIWEAAFGTDLRVFNFDAAGDVVQHFLAANGLHDVESITENVSPDPAITAAQTVFNTMRRDQVLPTAFDGVQNMLRRHDQTGGAPLPPIDRLMPSAGVLHDLVRDRAADIAQIDAMLARSGEPPLAFDSPPRQTLHPSPWEMDQLMLKLIFALTAELGGLRHQVATLQKQLADQTTPPKTDGARP